MDVFRATGSNHLVEAVFDDRKLACVEHHADVRVRKIEFLVSRASPRELTELTAFHIAEQQGAVGLGDQKPVLVNVDFADLVAILRLEDDALTIFNPLDDDLRQRHVGKFKFPFIAAFF
jgi:hypothetical protein